MGKSAEAEMVGSAHQDEGGPRAATLPPELPRLTKEERLTLENLALKVENLRLQQERMRQDFESSTRMLGDLKKESIELQQALTAKYGVDLATSTIQPDGTIMPKAPAPLMSVGR